MDTKRFDFNAETCLAVLALKAWVADSLSFFCARW